MLAVSRLVSHSVKSLRGAGTWLQDAVTWLHGGGYGGFRIGAGYGGV